MGYLGTWSAAFFLGHRFKGVVLPDPKSELKDCTAGKDGHRITAPWKLSSQMQFTPIALYLFTEPDERTDVYKQYRSSSSQGIAINDYPPGSEYIDSMYTNYYHSGYSTGYSLH